MNARQIFLWYFLALIVVQIVFYEQLNTVFDSWRMKGCVPVKDIDAYDLAVNPVNGDLWGISSDSLFQFDGQEWQIHKVSSLKEDYLLGAFIVFDPQGRLWQGGDDGVGVFDGHNWIFYTERDWGLPDTDVTSIAFDPTGKPWVGLSANSISPQNTCGGVGVLDGQRWLTYRFEDTSSVGPGCQSVQSIQFDSSDRAWIGLWNGTIMILERTQDETFQAVIPGGPVFSSTARGTGYFLIPEESFPNEDDKGPVVIKNFSTKPQIYSLANDGFGVSAIRSIIFDKRGNAWIISENKLYQFHNGKFALARSPAARTVMDPHGNLWSFGQGISVYNGKNWRTYRAGNSCIGNEDVRAIAFDNNNRAWVAQFPTFEQGFTLSTFDLPPHRVSDAFLRLRTIFLPPSNPWLRWIGPVILGSAWLLILLGAKWPALTFPLLNIALALASERIHNGQYNSTFVFELITLFSLGGGLVAAIANGQERKEGFWKNTAPGLYGTLICWLLLLIAGILRRIFGPSS